jgi:type VI secretion system protein ImpC
MPADKPEETTTKEFDLNAVFETARLPAITSDAPKESKIRNLNMVKVFTDTVEKSTQDKKQIDLYQVIQDKIDELDREITKLLNDVLHEQAFQDLEATWRGLFYLVDKTETSTRLKLRVLDVSRKELQTDLEKAVDFDQSALFKKVYEEEYGTLGGKPYGCLVGDFYFDRSAPSMALLKKLASVAAAAHAPLIAAAHASLFDLKEFDELAKPRDLSKIFESVEMAEWTAFRDSEDSRYVTLTLPKVLMRLPYDPIENPVDGLAYRERMGSRLLPDNTDFDVLHEGVAFDDNGKPIDEKILRLEPLADNYLWGNPAYIFAQRITDAFAKYSWTAAVRGVEGGGKVEDLPLHKFKTVNGDRAVIIPTQVAITDRREKELSDQGFISLVYCKDTNYAAFFGSQTVNKPKKFNTAFANSNAELSARLPYILNTSRFAHYIKVMMRNRIGTFMTKENVQSYLTTWISDYVLDKDDAGQELKARYPLREARIDVVDVPGQPGAYSATVFLRPHFQLEGLSASLRLVAELPPPAAA